jgi:hypothetical protein
MNFYYYILYDLVGLTNNKSLKNQWDRNFHQLKNTYP